ncbi:MAG: GNAT family N-acetyltransferase [Coriobacteriia bacterium]
MTRRLRSLNNEDLNRLPARCAGCAFWESAGERERRCGSTCDLDLRHAWHRRVTDEWGNCTLVAWEDDEILGFVKYAPSGYFPQVATLHATPPDPRVPLIACMHIVPEARHRGLGTVLLRATMRDLSSRGERRVEAFGYSGPSSVAEKKELPMLSVEFLSENGFTVVKADPVFPLMRLDLRSLIFLTEGLESALEALRLPLRVRKRAPASWMNGR